MAEYTWIQRAYDYLSGRRIAYRMLMAPGLRPVLEDLARFCRANQSTFHEDPRVHAVLTGRHEVWLRIQQHIQLSPEDLWKLYNPTTPLER